MRTFPIMIVYRRSAVALMVLAGLALPPVRPSLAAETQDPAPGSARPAAVPATGDEQARDLFRAERYPEALAVYQRLRAETRHPTYLRNIGRCHQMMRQPAAAIDAFEAYLRDATDLDAGERKEVQGYIAEMRRLEAKPSPASPPAGAASAPPPASVAVAAPPQAPPPAPTEPVMVTAPPASAATDGEPSVFRRWWFWAGVGALVVATGIVVGVAASGEDRLACPGGAVCP